MDRMSAKPVADGASTTGSWFPEIRQTAQGGERTTPTEDCGCGSHEDHTGFDSPSPPSDFPTEREMVVLTLDTIIENYVRTTPDDTVAIRKLEEAVYWLRKASQTS